LDLELIFMLYILLQLASFFHKQLITFFKMSLEQRIYLIQCWTSFRHIITKLNETFHNTHVSHMSVQKLQLRCRVELCAKNGKELILLYSIIV
jgi:hypothetical protein